MTMEKTRKQKKSNAKPKQLPLSLKADGPFAYRLLARRASLLWLTGIIYHALDFLEKRALLHMANVLNI